MVNVLNRLLDDEHLTDVLIAAEGRKARVHKVRDSPRPKRPPRPNAGLRFGNPFVVWPFYGYDLFFNSSTAFFSVFAGGAICLQPLL